MKRKQQRQHDIQNNDKRRRCLNVKKQLIPVNHSHTNPSSSEHPSEEEELPMKVQPQLQQQQQQQQQIQQVESTTDRITMAVEENQHVADKVSGEDFTVVPEGGTSVKPPDVYVPVGAVAPRVPPPPPPPPTTTTTTTAFGLPALNKSTALVDNRTTLHHGQQQQEAYIRTRTSDNNGSKEIGTTFDNVKDTYLKLKDLKSFDQVDFTSNNVDIMDVTLVPSPPPFVRSVAQVIHHSLPSTTTTTNAVANLNYVDFYKHDLINEESFDPFFHFDMKIDELTTIPQGSPISATTNTASYRSSIKDNSNIFITSSQTSATTSTNTKGVPKRSTATGITYSNVNKVLPTFRKNTKSTRFTSKQHHGSTSTLEDSSNTCDYEKVESLSKQLMNTSVEAETLFRSKDDTILSHDIQKVACKDTATISNLYGSVETIPPSFIKGKMINTKYGLAMVVVPISNVPTTDYMNTFCGSSTENTNPLWNSTTQVSEDKVTSRTSLMTAAIEHQEYKGTAPSFNGLYKHWLKAEDELLQYAVSQQTLGPPYMWKEIASSYFPNTRSAIQCKARWKKIDPQLTKSQFTADEDSIILTGQSNGLSWPDIAKQLPGRNAEQIRVRFLNAIDPSIMKNVGWTEQEEETLRKAQIAMGNKWTLIATLLPGRSPNDVKNHWHNKKLKVTRKMKSLALLNHRNEVMSNLRGTGTTVMTNGDLNQESADDTGKHDDTKPHAVTHV